MKYPMIEKLGLITSLQTIEMQTQIFERHEIVLANDLKKVLENAQRVYGRVDGDFGWHENKEFAVWQGERSFEKTHTALLLCIEPIKKGVTKDEIRACLDRSQDLILDFSRKYECIDILKRIEKEGIVD